MGSCTDKQFLKVAYDMADIIKREVSLHPHKQVIIRSTLPTHTFYTEDGSYHHTSSECWRESTENHFTNYYMELICKVYKFKFLNSAPIYIERGDLHYPEHTPKDCTHWCYSPEPYVPEISLMNELLR